MNLTQLKRLYYAISEAPPSVRQGIIDTIEDLDRTLPSGESLLSLAVMEDNHQMVSCLVDAGASPDVPNAAGVTPRMLASRIASTPIQRALDYAQSFTSPYPSHYFDTQRRLAIENYAQRCLVETSYTTARKLGILPTDVFTLSPRVTPMDNGLIIDSDLLFEGRTFNPEHKLLAAELTSKETIPIIELRGAAVYTYPVGYLDISGFPLRGSVLETRGLRFYGEPEIRLYLDHPITYYPLTYLDYLWDIMHALAFKVASGDDLISGMCYTEIGSDRNLHKAAVVPHLIETPNPADRYFLLHLLDISHDTLRIMHKEKQLSDRGTLVPEIRAITMTDEFSFTYGDQIRLSVLSDIERKSQTQSSLRHLYTKATYAPATIPNQESLLNLERMINTIRRHAQ